MTFLRILAIGFIFACTTVGWFFLGGTINHRTHARQAGLGDAVQAGWGPPMLQSHPHAFFLSPGSGKGRADLAPSSGQIAVRLAYEPKRRGLLWHRTYVVDFSGDYVFTNPTPVRQTVYAVFQLPDKAASYTDFSFRLGEGLPSTRSPQNGAVTEAVEIAAGASVPLRVTYRTRGTDTWSYGFGENGRVRQFDLQMETDFREIDFPQGTGSPTSREQTGDGWRLHWSYPDVLSAPAAGMSMPSVLNAGPTAARIAFFAPVSLLFFFAVIFLLGMVRNTNLHPMNYFFLAAGFFAFHLLFAYLVDVLPLRASFVVAAAVSVLLVGGYMHAVTRGRSTRVAVLAQLAYMVLFSYSFFFDGFTGLTVTLGAVATLATLMIATARVDWGERFVRHRATPPPVPAN